MLKIAVFAVAMLTAGSAAAQVYVQGYTRSNGTYVAPHYRSSPNGTTADNYGPTRAPAPAYTAPSYTAPRSAYSAPAAPACSGYGCYGTPSTANGQPRSTTVNGYTRRDGTYVAPYARSNPR